MIECTITVDAAPSTIFALYRDVEHWNRWDPDTRSSSLDGPFAPGTKGRLRPARGNEVGIEIVSVIPDRSFTVEGRIPLFRMVFDHELTPKGASTEVLHRVRFFGPLRFVFGPIVGADIRKGLPKTLASLKRMAESSG
jgi:Polyketide cyclase / dehydrase and lipid transport